MIPPTGTTPATRAVVLLSGGVDSTTVLAIARDAGFACHCLSFDYGQRHTCELDAARRVAAALGAVEHRIVRVDLAAFGGSALTGDLEVPKGRDRDDIDAAAEIPVTYVPARNTVFLSLALAYAETLEASDIFIGVNAIDYSGYPDCRPDFIAAFQRMADLATRAGVEGRAITVHTPLIELTKKAIIERGRALGVDYAMTFSCYDPDARGRVCGRCDACVLRAEGFAAAGMPDPAG